MKNSKITGSSAKSRIVISTTVPETYATILKGQPRFLANFFEISLVTSYGKMLPEVTQQENLPVSLVPMNRGISPIKDIISIIRMMRILRQLRPKVVHSYTPKAGLVTMLAGFICGVPVRVHTFTGLIFPTTSGFKKKILIFVDRLICACATHIIPEGQGVKKDLKAYQITQKPLNVIGYGNIAGVESTYFAPTAKGVKEAAYVLKKKFCISATDFVFCFIGRLNKDKGLIELIKAFSSLPESTHLLLVGELDRSAPIEMTTLAEIESNPRVHQLGFLRDIRPALYVADILVLPSYREGFPNVVLQAGAMGLPVIASDINGCNEVITNDFNGWLVPARDAHALQRAMRIAIQTPEVVRENMGLQARERIKERFERSEHWQRMVYFYRELLKNH